MPRSHALFSRLFDYTGAFPPASLPLEVALATFGRHRAGPSSWMLGRFVVPASRLEEVSSHAALLPLGREGSPGRTDTEPSGAELRSWRISALVTHDAGDAAHVAAFNRRHADAANGAAIVDTVELVVTSPDDVRAARVWASRGFEVYCEVSPGPSSIALIEAIARVGLHAKLRCGGADAARVPTCEEVAAFLCACVARGVVAKATAGLHHPITGVHPVSEASEARRTWQLGYLNLVMAAGVAEGAGRAAVQSDEVQAAVCRLLAVEQTPHWVGHAALEWRGDHGPIIEGPIDQFAIAGRGLIRSIGTCWLEEPMATGRAVGLIP